MVLTFVICRRQMVLSRFWFGWYGVKLSKLIALVKKMTVLTLRLQSPSSTFWPALVGQRSTRSLALSSLRRSTTM
jgi:purine-cytosine permease-like protein